MITFSRTLKYTKMFCGDAHHRFTSSYYRYSHCGDMWLGVSTWQQVQKNRGAEARVTASDQET